MSASKNGSQLDVLTGFSRCMQQLATVADGLLESIYQQTGMTGSLMLAGPPLRDDSDGELLIYMYVCYAAQSNILDFYR